MSRSEAITALKRHLSGREFTGVLLGDTCWALEFDGFWLVSQEIHVAREAQIASGIRAAGVPLVDVVDPDDLPRAVGILACRRRAITAVEVTADASLVLSFDGGDNLTFPVTAPTVDWYWSLAADPRRSPYTAPFAVACTQPGELLLGKFRLRDR